MIAWRFIARGAACAAAVMAGAAFQASAITWSGAGADDNWTTGGNWAGGVAPTGGADTVRFDQTDPGGTNILDSENLSPSTNIWHTGLFEIINTGGGTNDFTHLHDLHGKTLAVDSGNLQVGWGAANNTWARGVFSNGTLQIGTAGTPRDLKIGSGNYATYGELKLAPGTTLRAYINDFFMGVGDGGGGTLDLRGVTLDGGVLDIQHDLQICLNGNGGVPTRNFYILMDDTTGITEFKVRRYLWLGWNQQYYIRIGNPANSYKLPSGLNLTVGSASSRGKLYVGKEGWTSVDARLIAASNGHLTAYLDEMIVGRSYWGGYCTAYFDMSAMTNGLLDVDGTFYLPYGAQGDVAGYDAQVKLPPGYGVAGTLLVGYPEPAGAAGLLELNGTRFAVTNSVTVGKRGTVRSKLSGSAGGLDVTNSAAFAVTTPGKLDVQYLADQGGGGEYWGLRWNGKHMSELGAWHSDGRLIWTNNVAGKSVGLAYDGSSNMTYVTLRATNTWGPIAIPRDYTIEVRPPDYTTAVLTVSDLDAGSFDPNGYAITGRWVSATDNLTPAQTYVTLAGLGAHTVWLTVVNTNGVQGSNNCAVTLVVPLAPTTNNVTWDAGATTLLMYRPEWFWSRNWAGDMAPTNPTLATVTFGDTGLGTNILDADRLIGSLVINSTTGATNFFNLGGCRLAVTNGDMTVNPLSVGGTAAAVFSNGTLQIGTTNTPRNLTIGSWNTTAGYVTGRLKVAPGATFDANINVLTIGGWEAGQGTLDLRGAIIAGGVLKVGTLQTATSGNGALPTRLMEILIDSSTVLNRIEATTALDMGLSQANTFRMGDPANSYKLPPNLDIKVGVNPGTRGRIRLSTDAWCGLDGRVVATTNGWFSGYLTDLIVGGTTFGGFCYALLDLSAMTNMTLDVSGGITMPTGSDKTSSYDATISLPRGSGITRNITVGNVDNAASVARLKLNGTVLTATNAVTIGPRGIVSNNLNGVCCGLDLTSTATLSVSNSGQIALVFTAPIQQIDRGRLYWGLRWAGNHSAELQSLVASSNLVWNDAAISPYRVGVIYDSPYTYVGTYAARGTLFVVH